MIFLYLYIVVCPNLRRRPTPNINSEIECVECVPENLIGYIDRQERWAFILSTHTQKFIEDTAEYELEYLSVPSVQEKILQCSHCSQSAH